jgi:hypothetical protein
VVRAAAVGDVETVNKWLTARGYTHYGQLAAVITRLSDMDMITFVSCCSIVAQ